MKFLHVLVLMSAISLINVAVAMNIETGREFPVNRDQRTGRLLDPNLEQMPRFSGCLDYLQQAERQLVDLERMIISKKQLMKRMKFASQEAEKSFKANVEKEIKDGLNEIRKLLDQADKEAAVAL